MALVYDMKVLDLAPTKDPKGGSPRTPSGGINLPNYPEYQTPPPTVITTNGNGNGVWKLVACTAITACLGLIGMYFTAMMNKGVSQKDIQEYVEKFSPYTHDKALLALQQQSQDEKIGTLMGFKDRIFDRLNKIEETKLITDRDIQDQENKIKMLTNYIEAEKSPKK